MLNKLEEIEDRYEELNRLLSEPEIMENLETYQKLAREFSELEKTVVSYRKYKKMGEEIEENKKLLRESDEEIRRLAREEIGELEKRMADVEHALRILLIPKDPNDDKNIFLEIRAGTGGEEATLFAADLFRMYAKYSELQNWRIDIMNQNETGVGGFKEIIALIEGRGAYSQLKYESGVHRVQRVPTTESQGRVHTSAVTVAVLPEADEVEVDIDPGDLRIDVFRSSGPGGQSVNTTDSAVRVTHIPTALVVTCQDEKSQHKNKAKALKVLRSKLLDLQVSEQQMKISEKRRSMVGTGDRSERIRTYNFPQNRVTDHRIGMTLYKLNEILEGNIQRIIDAVSAHFQAEALKKQMGNENWPKNAGPS
ncbi:MAG: peptide chain release factor 1 [Proteobacteria bacterium]|nr:peptide chain release factor 1 [Pseudomonadota bacterium]NIS70684.1 peptide chain release factor 1 [Pseudomonadota bacterium]